jgi:hypothetical protein
MEPHCWVSNMGQVWRCSNKLYAECERYFLKQWVGLRLWVREILFRFWPLSPPITPAVFGCFNCVLAGKIWNGASQGGTATMYILLQFALHMHPTSMCCIRHSFWELLLSNPRLNLQRLWFHYNTAWMLLISRYLLAFVRLKDSRQRSTEIRSGFKFSTRLIVHNCMASLSVPYERNRSTYQHVIWFTLDWIHLLLNCPQFQKIVKPIREYFFTRNRKLYTLINSLQCVTAARKRGLYFQQANWF